MYLGPILWMIFIFILCCGATGSLGFILLVWTLGVIIAVILCWKKKIKE